MAVRVYIIKYLRPLDLLVLLREQYCRLWILYDIYAYALFIIAVNIISFIFSPPLDIPLSVGRAPWGSNSI